MSRPSKRRLWTVAIGFLGLVRSIRVPSEVLPVGAPRFPFFWLFIAVVAGFYSVRGMFRRGERTENICTTEECPLFALNL